MGMDRMQPSRRALLVAAGAVTAGGILPAHLAHATSARSLASVSRIGGWSSDARDLPTYEVTAALPVATRDASGAAYPLDPDPFFLIGNDRLSLFANASGFYRLMTGERAWARMNQPIGDAAPNQATLSVNRRGETSSFQLLGLDGVAANPALSRRTFGCGYASHALSPGAGVEVVRTLSIPPFKDDGQGVPAAVVTVRLKNTGRSACDITYREAVLSSVSLTIERNAPEPQRTVRFTNRLERGASGLHLLSHPQAHADDPGILRGRDEANRYDVAPPSLLLAVNDVADATLALTSRKVSAGATELTAEARLTLASGESRELTFIVGLCPTGSADALLAFGRDLEPARDGVHFASDWSEALDTFQSVADPVFKRELTWNAHALLAMATYSAFYDQTFIPQGMTYDYEMGMTAAPRDQFQHAMAAAYFRPGLAKSTIRHALSKMTPAGEIKYTEFGYGETSNSAWNTSDQQLYLFQALGEYLRITGDLAFMEEETTWLPREAGFKGSVIEKLDRAVTYLRDEVSTGAHGLVRLMNSDWSDMVYADTSVLRHFWGASSHMNSAMVMAVLPNLIEQLDRYIPVASPKGAVFANRARGSLALYLDRITTAMMRDMDGRTFSRRIYLSNDLAFGVDDMHIEPQSFLLQAPSFPVERKRRLWAEVQARLLAGEVVGPRQREKPVEHGLIEPFVSENGGFWYSLGGQMITGVATFDKPAALALLRRMTFDTYARNYPDYWTGLWSGADTINAVPSGPLAGLPRPDNNGQWTSFASYCAHVHAWPIYTWSKIAEA